MVNNNFFSVSKDTYHTSTGPVELPICYYDASMIQAFYWCDKDKVWPKLYGTGLMPANFFGGKILVGIAFFEYRKTDIGSYNEVGLAIGVVPIHNKTPMFTSLDFLTKAKNRRVGFYIVDLPVTTESASIAGRELWGYPKFITKITMDFNESEFSSSVLSPKSKNAILTFKTPLKKGMTTNAFDLVLYSNHHDSILKTIVTVKSKVQTFFGSKAKLTLEDTNHPMAKNIQDFEIDRSHPFLIQKTSFFNSLLNSGTPISPWKTPCDNKYPED